MCCALTRSSSSAICGCRCSSVRRFDASFSQAWASCVCPSRSACCAISRQCCAFSWVLYITSRLEVCVCVCAKLSWILHHLTHGRLHPVCRRLCAQLVTCKWIANAAIHRWRPPVRVLRRACTSPCVTAAVVPSALQMWR